MLNYNYHVPLTLKDREIIFLREKYIMVHLEGFFKGPKPFCPLNCPEHRGGKF
jgi:hypothetical protein